MRKVYLLLFALLQICSFANAQSGSYTITADGIMTKWSDASGDIVIPENVVAIAENCFYTPASTSDDGWGGDDGWGSSSSEEIVNTKITSIDFKNVKKIGKNALKGCSSLTSITATKLETIGEGAFDGCSSLASLSLPAIQKIGKDAFANCHGIKTVELGSGLTSVLGNSFKSCSAMESLTMTGTSTVFTVKNNAIIDANKTLVYLAGAAKSIELTESECTRIGEAAMYGNKTLTKISLPGVITVGNDAFNSCSSLSELLVPNLKEVEDTGYMTWNGVGSLSIVDIHKSVDFKSFAYSNPPFADKASTKIFVADANVQARLQQVFKHCQIIVGPVTPDAAQTHTINFSSNGTNNEFGELKAWTTGGIDVLNNGQIPDGNMITIQAIPRAGYIIDKWEVNNQVETAKISTSTTGFNAQLYINKNVTEDLTIKVTFVEQPKGHTIFFRSLTPAGGTLECRIKGGDKVESAKVVPFNSPLVFTAIPNPGYHVTQWFEEKDVMGDDGQMHMMRVPIEGHDNQLTYECTSYDILDISVDFSQNVGYNTVHFASLNPQDKVTATADGVAITNGASVKKGAKVVFTAIPGEGRKVDNWMLGDKVVPNETGLTYTIPSLNSNVEVYLICTINEGGGSTVNHEPTIVNGHLTKWNATGDAVTPASVEYIDAQALSGSSDLTSFHITKDVKYIGELPFLFCFKLNKITVDPLNPYFTEVDGVVYSKDKTRLVAYPVGREAASYEIKANVTSVQPGAFLTAIHLDGGVTVENGNAIFKAENGILYSKDGKTIYYYPTIPKGDEKIKIQEGVEKIGRYAMAYNINLKEVTFPSTLTEIEAYGMAQNYFISAFKWEDGVTPKLETIGDFAFFNNGAMVMLQDIPSLKKIGASAFERNAGMQSISIPNGCTIGKNAFYNCRALTDVFVYSVTPPTINEEMFTKIQFLDEARLHVDATATEAYKNAKGWSVFKKIMNDATGISTVETEAANIVVTAQNDGFMVEGMNNGQRYALYTVSGMKVAAGVANGNSTFVPAQRGQIYILKVEGVKTIKLY